MRQTFKDVGLNIVCICLITISIFLITRWAPIQSNNMEGGVTISIFLITRWAPIQSNIMEGGVTIAIFLITE